MTPAFPLSALAAATAVAAAPLAAPIVKDGVEITITQQVSPGAGSVIQVGLDIETTTAEATTRLGFSSLRAVADIDCGRTANRFVSAEGFDQPRWAGAGRPRNISGDWVQPNADSFMAAVVTRVCAVSTTAAASAHPPPVVRELTQSRPPVPKPSAAPPPAQAAAPAAAATPPAAATAVTPPPAGDAAAAPASPPPSPPLVVKFSGLPAGGAPAGRPAAAVSAPGPAYIPRTAGDRIAQVSASPSQQQAEKVLRQLRPLVGPPLTTTIEQAVVGAAHVWRADVVGFSSAADAKAFCRAAAHVSKTCWVRAKSDGPKPQAAPLRGPKPAPPRPAPAPRRAG